MADSKRNKDEGATPDRTGGDKAVVERRNARLSEDLIGKIYKPGKGAIDSRDLPPGGNVPRDTGGRE